MTVTATVGRGSLQRTSVSVTFTGASGLGLAATTTTFFTTTGEVLLVYLAPSACCGRRYAPWVTGCVCWA